jgi:hypothetical protein
MPDYSNGKIYTIRSRSCDLVYIGSTVQRLTDRFAEHKRHYNGYKQGKRAFVCSYTVFDKGDAYIELFELYPCNNRIELARYEGQCQRKYECVNNNIAGRTVAEYKEEEKEKISERNKKYYQKNREYYREYRKENRVELLKKMKEYRKKEESVKCEVCGSTVKKSKFKRHMGTKKHNKALENLGLEN